MSHMETLNKLRKQNKTHKCPECGNWTYCACDAGKSPNTCWCFQYEFKPLKTNYDTCMCEECLKKQLTEGGE